MINHQTARQETTWSWTRISTFFSNASSISGTIRIYRTLGSTVRWNTHV